MPRPGITGYLESGWHRRTRERFGRLGIGGFAEVGTASIVDTGAAMLDIMAESIMDSAMSEEATRAGTGAATTFTTTAL